jgi:hypothetical protein
MRALLVDYLTGYSHGSPLADNKAGHACKKKASKITAPNSLRAVWAIL